MTGKREYGDYQTPPAFAQRVCALLKDARGLHPTAIIEPTCGIGNFLKACRVFDADEIYGIEINPDYCAECEKIDDARIRIVNANLFSFNTKKLLRDARQALIIGNPPWASNSALSGALSDNLPIKTNFKRLKGLDALTGASNFDICEYMILQLAREYAGTNAAIAMLCKTSVARAVFCELKRTDAAFASFEAFEFDAGKVFGVAAGACLMLLRLSEGNHRQAAFDTYSFDDPYTLISSREYSEGRLSERARSADDDFGGESFFEWRQGVKHDCARVMELTAQDGALINGNHELVRIEDALVYPLIKSSMYKAPVIREYAKRVIVTQKKIGENTAEIMNTAPLTWDYLQRNRAAFERRKSVIYRGAPVFSMFGVGDYSFAPYKVGISGFYKKPFFSLLCPEKGKPAMTDDTSYFICLPTYDTAYIAMLLLNSEPVRAYLQKAAFLDAKRPYNKKLLSRLDFQKMISAIDIASLQHTEAALGLPPYADESMYRAFQSLLPGRQLPFAI